jgi:hypothetical protein
MGHAEDRTALPASVAASIGFNGRLRHRPVSGSGRKRPLRFALRRGHNRWCWCYPGGCLTIRAWRTTCAATLRRLAIACERSMDVSRMAVTFDPSRMRPGGCFTCRYAGAPIDATGADRRVRCTRSGHWSANMPENGCSGWEREAGSDDDMGAEPNARA